MHCTTLAPVQAALEGDALAMERCDVYGEDLTYLFYGRPAYKPLPTGKFTRIIDSAPICLIFDPILLARSLRILPFDSGGFARYADLIGHGLNLGDFELPGSKDTPARMVRAFFGSNQQYFHQEPAIQERDIPVSGRSARAVARVISDPSVRDMDDRCGTIEVQFSRKVPLAGALQAIVAPVPVLADKEIMEGLARCPQAVPLHYRVFGRFDPMGFTNTIDSKVADFLAAAEAF